MAKTGMRRYTPNNSEAAENKRQNKEHKNKNEQEVPELQGKAKESNEKANPID